MKPKKSGESATVFTPEPADRNKTMGLSDGLFIVAALAACIAVIVGMVGPVKAGRTPTNSQLSGPEKCWLEDKQFPFGQVFFFRGELLVSGSAIFEGGIFCFFFCKKSSGSYSSTEQSVARL